MSLYNMVAGYHPHAGLVLHLLGKEPGDFARFRDAWVERDEQGAPRLAIYTRLGGGNRDDCEDTIDSITEHPLYLHDADDSFDCTYATFYFRVPDEHLQEVDDALPKDVGPVDTDARWQQLINSIGDPA